MTDSAHPDPTEMEHLFDPVDETPLANATILYESTSSADNELFQHNEEETTPYEQPDDLSEADKDRTLYMTSFFLVLMVLYLGFCCYYRKVKVRSRVDNFDDNDDGDNMGASREMREQRRRQQRENNQQVLDESLSAASRARESEDEAKKLEERKGNIRKALLLRLIVDDEEEEEKEGEAENGAAGEKECDGNCECEQCLYWKWDSLGDNAKGAIEKGGDEEAAAMFLDAAASKRGIVAIEEGDEESDQTDDAEAGAKNVDEDHHDVEAQTCEDAKAAISPPASPTLSSLDPPLSPTPSPQLLAAQPPPASPTRLSLTSPRNKYADALNCGSNVRRHASHAMNCSNHNIACGNTISSLGATMNNSLHNMKLHMSKHDDDATEGGSSSTPTISLESIIVGYGEECNICLSQFQVGDRAAWSRLCGSDKTCETVPQDGNISSVVNAPYGDLRRRSEMEISDEVASGQGCTHVFHEECISRWLLVRDGCPICRRSYFPNGNDAGEEGTAADGTNQGGRNSHEIDLESGVRR